METLAVDFANTVQCDGCRVPDGLASAAEARRWLASHQHVLGPVRGHVPREEFLRFRGTIRSLFGAAVRGVPPRALDVAALNRASGFAPTHLELEWKRGTRRSREVSRNAPHIDHLLASLATSAITVLVGTEDGRLRQCEGPECAHFLIARNSRQLWCSPTGCGNRARVARHYARTRASLHPT